MAVSQIVNYNNSDPYYGQYGRTHPGYLWVKRRWADNWQRVPYLYILSCEQNAAPSLSMARFEYVYGKVRYPLRDENTFYPLDLQDWFVLVYGFTVGFRPAPGAFPYFPAFIGVFQAENLPDTAVSSDGTASGRQYLTAYGLEWLLKSGRIAGSYTNTGEGPYGFVSRVLTFNNKRAEGLRRKGNKTPGTLSFANSGDLWSNYDMINYLLLHFNTTTINFELSGEVTLLQNLYYEFDPSGLFILDALEVLIDRRRGLGWTIVSDGVPGNTVYIHVFTSLQYPIWFDSDFVMPANPMQLWLLPPTRADMNVDLTISRAHSYGVVIAKGARIKTTMSFSPLNGTLVPGWTAAEQEAYEAATDEERSSEALSRVYRYYVVPADFDFTYLGLSDLATELWGNPEMLYDGTLSTETRSTEVDGESPFMDFLPFQFTDTLDDEGLPYRRPFVLMDKNNDLEDTDFEYIEKMKGALTSGYGMGISTDSRGIWLFARANHIFAANHFTGDPASTVAEELDYDSIILTATIETDNHLRVVYFLPSYFEGREVLREMVVEAPHLETWFVAADTVLDASDGELQYANSGTPYVARDDAAELRALATAAASWYAQQRNSVTVTRKGILDILPVGALVTSAAQNAYRAVPIGTVVTRREFDFTTGTTTIQTGYSELDVEGFRQ